MVDIFSSENLLFGIPGWARDESMLKDQDIFMYMHYVNFILYVNLNHVRLLCGVASTWQKLDGNKMLTIPFW